MGSGKIIFKILNLIIPEFKKKKLFKEIAIKRLNNKQEI